MGAALFWGLLLIVLGITLVFKVIFNIQLPLFRIVVAFILIYLGLRILFGNFKHPESKNDIIFADTKVNNLDDMNREYNVIFGKGSFDFRDIDFTDNQPVAIELNTVFGSSEITLNKNMPVKIKGETVFANLQFPNGNSTFFGDIAYHSDNFDESKPYVVLKVTAVFSNVEIFDN